MATVARAIWRTAVHVFSVGGAPQPLEIAAVTCRLPSTVACAAPSHPSPRLQPLPSHLRRLLASAATRHLRRQLPLALPALVPLPRSCPLARIGFLALSAAFVFTLPRRRGTVPAVGSRTL